MLQLNEIRRKHPALQQLRQVELLETNNDDIFAFIKKDGDSEIIVVVSLNENEAVSGEVSIPDRALPLGNYELIGVHDELSGRNFVWGRKNFVALDPANPAHILVVQRTIH